jgi:tetratricopeptide (TPR) repeat protein
LTGLRTKMREGLIILLLVLSVPNISRYLSQSSHRNSDNIMLIAALMNTSASQQQGLTPYRIVGNIIPIKRWIADLERQPPQPVDLAWVHRDLGLAYLSIGDDFQARSDLDHSRDEVAQIHLVLLDAYEKKWGTAVARLRLLGSAETLASSFVAIANSEAFANQKFEHALSYLELAARLDTQGYDALLARGRVLQILGEYGRSLADYALVQDRCPTCWQPYSYRAEIYAVTGRGTPGQIEQDIRYALRLAPNNGFVEAQLGFWLRDHSRDAEAVQQFERVIQDWPEFLDAYFTLAQLYQKQGDTQQSLAVLALALERFSDPAQTNQVVDVIRSIQNSQ